jgi:DNA-directed RNA polymerase subunit RPC12/RpoP
MGEKPRCQRGVDVKCFRRSMSEFKYACPVCGQHIKCDSSQAGSVMECPTCFQKITVPQAPATADQKFILTGTKVSEKKTSPPGFDAAIPATPKKNSTWAIVITLVLALAAAGAAILFVFPRAPLKNGAAGLGTWGTAAEFDHFVVTKGNRVLFKSNFPAGTEGWRFGNGDWTTQDGYLRQSTLALDCRAMAGETGWSGYTVSVRARKVGGNEGFLILFNAIDKDNWTWWNVGGWGNTKCAIENCVSGNKSTLGDAVAGKIETGKWYDLRVELSGPHIRCYLNNALVQDATYPAPKP